MQLRDIRDIAGIDIRSLEEVSQGRKYMRIRKIEMTEEFKKMAPSVPAYILYEHHFNGKNIPEIAKGLDCSRELLLDLIAELGIPTRNVFESLNLMRTNKRKGREERKTRRIPCYFIKDGQRTPFHEFLNNERLNYSLTWDELSNICCFRNMAIYMCQRGSGRLRKPSKNVLTKVADVFGYGLNDFIYSGRDLQLGTEEKRMIKSTLLDICMEILKRQKEKPERNVGFSSTVVREVAGEAFYKRYARTHQSRFNLTEILFDVGK